jgi:hypothetical protein
MRIKYRTATAVLLVVTALGAAAGSAAAALPEFRGASFPVKYKFNSAPLEFYETGFLVVTCSSGTGEGSITGSKTLTGKLAFSGCKTSAAENCTSEGAKVGEIKTGEQESLLAYTSKVPVRQVGIAFNYKNGTFASFTCGGRKGMIRGGVIAKVKPAGLETSEFTLSFEGMEGRQTPSQYENETGGKVTCAPEISLVSETFGAAAILTKGALSHFESGGKSTMLEIAL